MSKRFTETSKWDDPWFRELPGVQKLVFMYIIDRCDNAGFWEIDEGAIAWHTKLDPKHIQGALKGLERGLKVVDGWAWVRTFLRHQKNEILNESNPAHRQIIGLFKNQIGRFSGCPDFDKIASNIDQERGFQAPSKGLPSPIGIGKGKGEGIKKEGSGEKTPEFPIDLPPSLDTDEFKAEWADFIAHRAAAKKKLTPQAARKQLAKLEAMGHDRAVAAVKHSVGNGWQGIFEPEHHRDSQNGVKQTEAQRDFEKTGLTQKFNVPIV